MSPLGGKNTVQDLTLAAADAAILRGLAAAVSSDIGAPPVSIAVLDVSGALLCFKRADGAFPASASISAEKARTALDFRKDTMILEETCNSSGKGRSALGSSGYCVMGGGVPVMLESRALGAVGVSGATPQQDHAIAKAVAEAILSGLAAAEEKVSGMDADGNVKASL